MPCRATSDPKTRTTPEVYLTSPSKTLIKVDQTMQHVYMGPPGMNQKAAAAFRKAIVPALATEAFKKDAMKILTYVPGAVEYNKAQQIIASTKDVPASVVKYLKVYIAKHTK